MRRKHVIRLFRLMDKIKFHKQVRRICYVLIALILSTILIESLLVLFFKKITPEKTNPAEIVLGENISSGCFFGDIIYPHPYLEYIYNTGCKTIDNEKDEGTRNLILNNSNQISFHEMPARNDKNYFDILLLGGSVASDIFLRGIDYQNKTTYLESELNKKYKSPNGRPFRLFVMAYGGWKYPNQFISFSLYTNSIDAVITLDGYNESHLFALNHNKTTKQEWFFPTTNPLLENPTRMYSTYSSTPTYKLWLINQYKNRSHSLRNKSYLVAIFRKTRLKNENKKIYLSSQKNGVEDMVGRTFSAGDVTERDLYSINIEHYKKYLRMINAIAKNFGIKNLHLIQPVPALYKNLTAEEKRSATYKNFKLDYGNLYNKMSNDLLTLQNQGLPIRSLLKTFQSHEEPVYIDEIHLSTHGNKILSDALIEAMAQEWNLKKN